VNTRKANEERGLLLSPSGLKSPNQLSKIGENSGLLGVERLKRLKTELEATEEAC
jgi:hypothetical protein